LVDVIPGFGLNPKSLVPPATAHILIVDDEPRIRSAYRQLLAARGRVIEECGTGREAITRLDRQDVDVVILDLNLPDINGREVMEWISGSQLTTSVIVFSAEEAIDAAILALRRGACEFIRKNADPDDLVKTVDMALRRRHMEREHALMTAQLEQSERLHRFLVENSPDIIYTLDSSGCFVFINGRIEALLGYAPSELVGRHYSTIVDEQDIEHARYAFAERRVGTRATTNHEIRLRCKNDEVMHFENRSIVAILSSQGIYAPPESASTRQFMGTSGVLRDITDRKRAEETITFQAFHDLLTGLPNRVLFRDRLELAISQGKRRNQRVGVMYMDIDRFKLVNDTYGHAEGDDLLKQFSQRVRECLRVSDTLSRQGGDEFTVLLPDVESIAAVEKIAEKILLGLRPPFAVGGKDFRTTASIGIAVFPDDGHTPEILLRNADVAMYQIKAKGRNGACRYSPDMGRGRIDRIELDNELRTAVSLNQFELYYQPQINVRTGSVFGVEALIRWNHPTRGLVGPNSFIPVAEDIGLIMPISDWVINEACRQLAEWQLHGIDAVRMSINVSAIEFERADFVQRMVAPLIRHGVAHGRIEIEITESLLMNDAESIIDKVRQLREHGLRVSIDDFGTRYSSLNYLRRFAVNSVKIDQSFVRDIKGPEDASPVISAIVGIARGFDLHVIAEGVETPAQKQALLNLGCEDMQGFHFAPPRRAEDLLKLLVRAPAASRKGA
jgi:diguanylate cyclase (GGDEF)-like protein/PAS domain S-box-containing protein